MNDLPGPLLLGHRGHRLSCFPERENSIAAFDRALAAGCQGLELDLRLTADGRVVIHHDPELKLGWRSSPRAVRIAGANLRVLQRLEPGLATLDQVLRRYRRRAWLDLEIKALEAVPATARLLRRWPPEVGYVISSFDLPALAAMAEIHPAAPLCLNLRRPAGRRHLQHRILRGLGRAGAVQWIAPHQAACTARYVRHLRAAGWKVLVWTVNRPAKMRLLARAGVEVLVSDDPGLLVEILNPEQTRPPTPHPL